MIYFISNALNKQTVGILELTERKAGAKQLLPKFPVIKHLNLFKINV